MDNFEKMFLGRSFGLMLPKRDKSQIEKYVAMHSSINVRAENSPFPRQIDFWAFSIAAALVLKLDPLDGPPSRWGTVFIYTSQGVMNNDLCSLLAVVAVAKMGCESPDVADPQRIVELSNRLAGAGCPKVLEKLSVNALRTTPLDRAIELARSLKMQMLYE